VEGLDSLMRFAYADPPYPGCAHHYGRTVDVNHRVLIGTLAEEYPDGWALSTHSNALRDLLPQCPADTRVAAWVKPFAAWKKGVIPPYAWEPVLFRTTKRRSLRRDERVTMMKPSDWISDMPPVFVKDDRGLKGVKSLRFCLWILDMLGLEPGDTLDDVFPGSGIMSEALRQYGRQCELFKPARSSPVAEPTGSGHGPGELLS
jgi:hypothetical protein